MIMHIYDEIDYRLDAINEEILLVPRTGANISDKTGDAVILRHFVKGWSEVSEEEMRLMIDGHALCLCQSCLGIL